MQSFIKQKLWNIFFKKNFGRNPGKISLMESLENFLKAFMKQVFLKKLLHKFLFTKGNIKYDTASNFRRNPRRKCLEYCQKELLEKFSAEFVENYPK